MASKSCFSESEKSRNYLQFPQSPRREIPYPKGPYTTGCADLLIGNDVDGSLLRLFYPTDENDIKCQPRDNWTPWYLGDEYIRGACSTQFRIPIFNSRLNDAFHRLLVKVFNSMFGKTLIPTLWEAPISNGKNTIPVIIFSHGLSANRSAYSGFCTAVASRGILIAAVEHRDESAGTTFTLTSEGIKNWMPYKQPEKESLVQTRNRQVKIRSAECSRALDILNQLNEGIPLKNLLNSSFDMESLKGRLDLSKPSIAGQSFGGATVLKVLGDDKRFQFGISMDPWMIPVITDVKSLSQRIQKPIIFILMEQFQSKNNMKILKLFQNDLHKFYTIKKAIHDNQIDTAILMAQDSMIAQKILRVHTSRFSAEVPFMINNALVMKFILKNLGKETWSEEEMEDDALLKREEKHILEGIHGIAKSMLEWDSCSMAYLD